MPTDARLSVRKASSLDSEGQGCLYRFVPLFRLHCGVAARFTRFTLIFARI